jgi:hypothetical protein
MGLTGRALKFTGVCACLALATWLSINSHRPRGISETSALTMDGARLSSVFEGLRPDPQYGLRKIPVHNATVIRCPAQARTWVEKVKAFLVQSAYASGNCPNTPCGGKNYQNVELKCTASGCQGSFGSAQYNPGAPLQNGVQENGTFGCTPPRVIRARKAFVTSSCAPCPRALLARRIMRNPAMSGNFARKVAAASSNAPWAPSLPITLHASWLATASPATATTAAAPTASPARMLVVPGTRCVPMGTA